MHTLLAGEVVPIDQPGTCGHPPAWRCLDCHGKPTYCISCCEQEHRQHPLHRIEFWRNSFFQQAWLRQTGLQVHCGHGGTPCP
ncbi:hypothetical protein OH76DRAFT_1348431, partial [Lentinus brumalis]